MMKTGALIYDEQKCRLDIRFGSADYYGGLHCGETFEVMIDGEWIPTRIEKACDWFLNLSPPVGNFAHDF